MGVQISDERETLGRVDLGGRSSLVRVGGVVRDGMGFGFTYT